MERSNNQILCLGAVGTLIVGAIIAMQNARIVALDMAVVTIVVRVASVVTAIVA